MAATTQLGSITLISLPRKAHIHLTKFLYAVYLFLLQYWYNGGFITYQILIPVIISLHFWNFKFEFKEIKSFPHFNSSIVFLFGIKLCLLITVWHIWPIILSICMICCLQYMAVQTYGAETRMQGNELYVRSNACYSFFLLNLIYHLLNLSTTQVLLSWWHVLTTGTFAPEKKTYFHVYMWCSFLFA